MHKYHTISLKIIHNQNFVDVRMKQNPLCISKSPPEALCKESKNLEGQHCNQVFILAFQRLQKCIENNCCYISQEKSGISSKNSKLKFADSEILLWNLFHQLGLSQTALTRVQCTIICSVLSSVCTLQWHWTLWHNHQRVLILDGMWMLQSISWPPGFLA